jgi:gliding motility-associated-like protein
VADVIFPECNADDQTNAVIYYFEIPGGGTTYGIHVSVLQEGSNPINPRIVAGISAVDTDFCTGTTYIPPAYCAATMADAEFEFTCLEPGLYQLQISSSDGNSGTFEIRSEFIDKPVSACNDNDYCADATSIDITTTCEWIDFSGCNTDACPDQIVVGACDLSEGPTVWYSVLIPTGAASLEVSMDGASFNAPVLAVFSECPVQTGWCNGTTTLDPIDVSTTNGSTYYIAVSDGDGVGGTFDLHVKIDVPPINDSPCMASVYPPYNLGTSGSHTGTTCCAIGANDDSTLDQANVDCNSLTDDNAVWYRAEFAGGAYDGVEIYVTGGTIGANATVEVYVGGADAACDGTAEFKKSKCDGLPVNGMKIGCIEAGDYIFIKVASTDGDCGTFSVSIAPIEDCDVADDCADITSSQIMNPVTPVDVSINTTCLSGCLELACPEPSIPGGSGCDFTVNPTVWFQVNTDNEAAQLYSFVTTSGTWTPVWSVYAGNCSGLTNAAGAGSFPCSSQSTPPTLLVTGVTDNTSYYIAVTADPNGPPIDDPNFQICVATIKNVVVCLGDDLGCAPDASVVWEITARENANAEPSGPPYFGPFCPGEELHIELSYFYDATETGDDWLLGMIPKFSCGWDVDNFDFAANAPTGNGQTADWYEETGPCPPQMMENVGHLCTYTDDDGHLRLVNTLCEVIPAGASCSGGLQKFDPLPSGYFWVREGGSPDCDPSNCSPSRKYGIGSPTASISWSFDIKVKEFADQPKCLECNDLNIIFQTFSDGAAGCWDDPIGECLIDKPQWSPTWQINCDVPPGVIGIPDPQNICTGNAVGMTVATEDGSVNVIEITFEDNPNVTGESNHTFNSGTGSIDDILTITDPNACDPELVIYYGQVIIAGMVCEGKIDTFEVNVYPLPKIPDDDIPGVCFSSLPYTLTFNADCGYPGDYAYQWADDISGKTGTGNQILIDNTFGAGTHTFTISITDELGCENTNILEFEVYDDVVFYLQGDTLCWGEEKEFIPEFFGSDVSTDFTYDWYWQSGIGLNSTDPTLYISEQDYGNVYYPGPQQLCLIVYETHSDGVVCQADTCVDVIFSNFFNLHLDPYPAYICAGQGCVDIELIFDDENGIKYDDVADIAWNGSPGGNVIQEFCNVSYGNFVVITDIFGCDTIIYFDVEQNPITPLTITGDTIICEGESTTLTISENFDSYQWSTGDINKIITVSPNTTTTYTVSAINNSGCVSSGDITVEVFGAEVPDIPATISFCTGYSITYTAPAGYASYKWYYLSTATAPISVSPTIVIDKPGDYILVITTSIGCTAQNTIKAIEDNELSPVVFGDFLLCYEQPTAEVWASGGIFTRLEWRYTDKNGNLVPNTTDKDTVNLSDGKYYVWVSDGNCAGDTTFTIVRKPKIEPKIMPDRDTIELCYGQTTTLTAPAGFAQYQWSSGQFTQIISNVGKGKYIVTVTDADGCIGVDSIYVEVYPKLLPKLQDSVNICNNESVWLKPGNFFNFKWYKNNMHLTQYDGVDSIQVSENALFIVQVFNEIGCTAYDTIRVIKDAHIVPGILGIVELCDDELIVLSSSQNYAKYKWTNSDGKVLSTAKTCNFTMTLGKNTEQVTLLVENANGCTGTVTKPVNRYNTPILRLSNVIPTVCGKNTTSGNTILDFSTYFITGSNSDGTWTELDASGATHNANWTQVNFSNVQYGKTYRFVFTTNTAHAPCTNISDTLNVSVVECICDSWDITALNDVCNDASSSEVNLNTHIVDQNGVRITPPPPGTWTVLNGTADLINGINFVPANAPSKTYTLQYKLTNIGNYCVDTATVTITVQNSVKPGNPLPFSICAGTDVLIRLDSMLVGESAGGVWTETSSVASTGNAFKASAGTFTTAGQLPATYTFKYTLDAVAPCPDADATVTIIIDLVPGADAGPDQSVCFEDKPVKLSTSSVGEMYSWRLKGTTNILADTKEYSASQSGTYVLRVQTGKGCFREDEVDVTIKDQIVVNISGTTILRNGETDTLFATYTGRNIGDKLTYNWTKDGVQIQQSNSNFIIVSEGGNYCVDIEDEQNCLGSDCHVVGVELTKEINIPNIFSPDGDSKNDRFFVKDGKNVSHIRTIKVYDRWGELVWSDGDYAFANRFDHFWDGMLNGKKAMQGVYVYLVEFTWSDGEKDFVAGDVTLVR